jgi:hypothetical protein
MPGFFEAFKKVKTRPEKKYSVIIDGKEVQVDVNTKRKIIMKGEQAFTWKDAKVIEKPKSTRHKVSYKILKRDKYGFIFYESDPHWPVDLAEGGFTWQKESE